MAIPGVDIVVGTQDRTKMLDYIEQFKQERKPINGVGNIMKIVFMKNWMFQPLLIEHVHH